MPWWTSPSRCSRSPTPVALEQVDGALLQHAGPHALLDVLAGAAFEHDRLDALAGQEVGEHQPGRPGPDDGDLGPHQGSPNDRRGERGGGERLLL